MNIFVLPLNCIRGRGSVVPNICSGVTSLEGARGHGMAGCHMIKKRLRKVQTIEARNMRELCGVGSRGRSPQKGLCFSMQKQHFQRKLHRLKKIFNMGGGLKQLQAKRADRALVRGVDGGPGGWLPGGGCKGALPPCLRKFCILQAKYA